MNTIELRFSLPPAGLRRNHEASYFAANALKDSYSELMMIEAGRQPNAAVVTAWARQWPIREYHLHAAVTWKQTGEGDVDNTLAALKPLFDNLGRAPVTKAGANRYYLGVYDSDSQLKRICVERERVPHKVDECVIVRIEVLR